MWLHFGTVFVDFLTPLSNISLIFASKLLKGTPQSSTFGCLTMPCPEAILCCCPPLRVVRSSLSNRSPICKSSAASINRLLISLFSIFLIRRRLLRAQNLLIENPCWLPKGQLEHLPFRSSYFLENYLVIDLVYKIKPSLGKRKVRHHLFIKG